MERRPAIIWLSFALIIATAAVATWQALDSFQKTPAGVDNPSALGDAGLLMGLTLAAVWLVVGLPAIGILFGVRFCRAILAVVALLGLPVFIFYAPPGGWTAINFALKAVQVFAIGLLFVGPSRAFFQRHGDE